MREIGRNMRGFDWLDERACRNRYADLLNASRRHTRCGKYCLKNGSCRFVFPKPRNDNVTIRAHVLVSPPTKRIDDWQDMVTLPIAWSPDEGGGGLGPCDEYVNHLCDYQILGTSTAPPSSTTVVPTDIWSSIPAKTRLAAGRRRANPACVRYRRTRRQRRRMDDATSHPAQSGYDVHHAQGHGREGGNVSAATVKRRCAQSRVRQGGHAGHRRRSGCGEHAEACRQA